MFEVGALLRYGSDLVGGEDLLALVFFELGHGLFEVEACFVACGHLDEKQMQVLLNVQKG